MTIVDFLLARIAEDEAQARRRFDEWHKNGGTLDLALTLGPSRVLAECEAKRRIVAELREYEEREGVRSGAIYWAAERTLQHLALPYADHPDYREEWKP